MARTAMETVDYLFKCLEAKQVAEVAALYRDDIEVWHNFSNAAMSKTDNLRILGDMAKSVAQIRYEVVERHDLGAKIVQRHTLRCKIASGAEFAIPACIFITVQDGKIRRIEEYLDSAQANLLRDATGRPRIEMPRAAT